MIAGTYTPFTTCRLHGVWAIGMTAAVWTGAITGAAAMKLICPRGLKRGSIVAYLALGWMILAGDTTHARLGGRFDGDFDRSWGRALFHRRRLSPLADAALPQRNMAQLRAGRSQLSLRSYSARRSLGTNLSAGWQKLNLSLVRGAMPRCSRYAGVWRSCRLSHETSRHLLLFRCLKRTQSRHGSGRVWDVQEERRDERGDQTEQAPARTARRRSCPSGPS